MRKRNIPIPSPQRTNARVRSLYARRNSCSRSGGKVPHRLCTTLIRDLQGAGRVGSVAPKFREQRETILTPRVSAKKIEARAIGVKLMRPYKIGAGIGNVRNEGAELTEPMA